MEKTINQADLFIFMGQSNMAGRGDLPETISCIPEAGFEFRAISDPSRLYPVEEPFGSVSYTHLTLPTILLV